MIRGTACISNPSHVPPPEVRRKLPWAHDTVDDIQGRCLCHPRRPPSWDANESGKTCCVTIVPDVRRKLPSHLMAALSRWLVGSSSRSTPPVSLEAADCPAGPSSSRASAMRICTASCAVKKDVSQPRSSGACPVWWHMPCTPVGIQFKPLLSLRPNLQVLVTPAPAHGCPEGGGLFAPFVIRCYSLPMISFSLICLSPVGSPCRDPLQLVKSRRGSSSMGAVQGGRTANSYRRLRADQFVLEDLPLSAGITAHFTACKHQS